MYDTRKHARTSVQARDAFCDYFIYLFTIIYPRWRPNDNLPPAAIAPCSHSPSLTTTIFIAQKKILIKSSISLPHLFFHPRNKKSIFTTVALFYTKIESTPHRKQQQQILPLSTQEIPLSPLEHIMAATDVNGLASQMSKLVPLLRIRVDTDLPRLR